MNPCTIYCIVRRQNTLKYLEQRLSPLQFETYIGTYERVLMQFKYELFSKNLNVKYTLQHYSSSI